MSIVPTPNSLKASCIIPVRNDASNLRRCLQSLSLMRRDAEIVVVDNGSVDDSREVSRGFGVKVFEYPMLRVGALRNRGVAGSSGDVLVFVDSDHELPPDWLEVGLSELEKHPEITACGAFCLAPRDGTWVQKVWEIHRLRGSSRREVDWLGAGNLFVRRDAFLEIGGFREDLVASEDVDLCHRIRQNGGRILLDPRIRNIHHGEPKTLQDFVKKEFWRGSSGLKAWVSHGLPVRELPSFIWPIWHLIIGLMLAIVCLYSLFRPNAFAAYLSGALLFLWVIPSLLLSAKTCSGESKMRFFPQLALLYFMYGLARAAALFKI